MLKNSPESSLELLCGRSVVLGLLHDLADDLLLALQVVVVKVAVHLLHDRDPLQHVEDVEIVAGGIV
jgi:hypothetical protein